MEMSQAFAVSGEAPPDRPPTTAEEYLQQVRWQANRIDDVIVAIDKPTPQSVEPPVPVFGMQGFSMIPITPPGMKPSPDWEKDFLADFLRQRCKWEEKKRSYRSASPQNKGPPPHDRKQWYNYCFTKGTPPLASVILSLDFVSLEKILTYHVRWAQTEPMSPHRARWLFVLLLQVELPLSPDLGSELYALVMRCATLRSKLNDINDPILPHLNILITLLEKFFKQVLDVVDLQDSEEEGEEEL